MLKLKHHFHTPSMSFGTHSPLKLAPIPVDDGDELTRAIAADPIDHDDNWSLDERPVSNELEAYWSEVTSDLKKDPDWVDFAQE